jgi:hypothetical protein
MPCCMFWILFRPEASAGNNGFVGGPALLTVGNYLSQAKNFFKYGKLKQNFKSSKHTQLVLNRRGFQSDSEIASISGY